VPKVTVQSRQAKKGASYSYDTLAGGIENGSAFQTQETESFAVFGSVAYDLTENLTGQARMIRAYALPALENVALWHERDISHSSVERYIGPDATVTLDFALARLTGVIDKLLVYPERMEKNLNRMGGLIHSQRILLALTQAGLTRDDSYRLVQRNAMKVWESDGGLSLLDLLKADADVSARLSNAELEGLFDLGYHFRHIDTIFTRVFG
jgi:adenylosuccinate lyase